MDLWLEVLHSINQKISRPNFHTWFANTTAEWKDDVVFVKANNIFQADWLDARYKQLISETIEELKNKNMEIKFVVDNERKELDQEKIQYRPSETGIEELKRIIEAQQKKLNELEERVNRLENKGE